MKNCTWEATCNHNKDSSWPVDMLTAVEFLTPASVYIKHVCTLPLFYIQIHVVSIPGSLWSQLSTKWCWLWHGYSTQEPALMRNGDYHKLTVLILMACPHLIPGSAGIKQPCCTPKSWLPQEESHETGMSGYTSERRRLPPQHTHMCPIPTSTHLWPWPRPPPPQGLKETKALLYIIGQCSFLIYTHLERGFCMLFKSHESHSSLQVPFLAQEWSLDMHEMCSHFAKPIYYLLHFLLLPSWLKLPGLLLLWADPHGRRCWREKL